MTVADDRFWHFRDIAMSRTDFRFRCKSNRAAEITALTEFGPEAVFRRRRATGSDSLLPKWIVDRQCGALLPPWVALWKRP
jgi:hypothetical protein